MAERDQPPDQLHGGAGRSGTQEIERNDNAVQELLLNLFGSRRIVKQIVRYSGVHRSTSKWSTSEYADAVPGNIPNFGRELLCVSSLETIRTDFYTCKSLLALKGLYRMPPA